MRLVERVFVVREIGGVKGVLCTPVDEHHAYLVARAVPGRLSMRDMLVVQDKRGKANPEEWVFQRFPNVYEGIRMAENVDQWAASERLPDHAAWSTSIGMLYGHALLMRKDDPATIARVQGRAKSLALRMAASSHPIVQQARQRVERATNVDPDLIPSYFASLWSARWLLDDKWAPHLREIDRTYASVRDALMAYNGSIALVVQEAQQQLAQIASAGVLATRERPRRLVEITQALEGCLHVSPWHRPLNYIVGRGNESELSQAMCYCVDGRPDLARPRIDRAARALKFPLARYRGELVLQRVSVLLSVGGSLTRYDVEAMRGECEEVLDTFMTVDDADFANPVRDRARPALRHAIDALDGAKEGGEEVLEVVYGALTEGFAGV